MAHAEANDKIISSGCIVPELVIPGRMLEQSRALRKRKRCFDGRKARIGTLCSFAEIRFQAEKVFDLLQCKSDEEIVVKNGINAWGSATQPA